MAKRARSRVDDERGATLVLMVTGVLVALLGITGLVIDLGVARKERNNLQSLVDAAALAGAQSLGLSPGAALCPLGPGAGCARITAATYAGHNLGHPASVVPATAACPGGAPADTECYTVGEILLTVTSPYDLPSGLIVSESLVHVKACEAVDTSFMQVFGWDELDVCTDATGRRQKKGQPPSPPGILILGKQKQEAVDKNGTKQALHTHGYIKVTGWQGNPGVIHVDSKHASKAALIHDKKSVTIADRIEVVGGTNIKPGASLCAEGNWLGPFACLFTPMVVPDDVMGDPLEDLPEPPGVPNSFPGETKADKKTIKLSCSNVCIYGKIKAQDGGDIELKGPGVFIVNGIEVKGSDNGKSSVVSSKDAMIFNVGKITVSDGGELNLGSMNAAQASSIGFGTNDAADYTDIALFQARCRSKDVGTEKCDAVNAKGQKIQIKGKKGKNGQPPTWTFAGTVYAANSKLEIKGDAEDEDPASYEDDDETNDPNDDFDDASELDPEAVQKFTKAAVIVGELSVGKKARIEIDTQWPPAAGYKIPNMTLVE